jgi:hypothetical protein
MVEWDNGETTMEPLQFDTFTCAVYAKDNGLLITAVPVPGWYKP